ncbi:hypothetical protein DERF_005061 [Dermatophagoides farinae]|uniref:Uncharacterized protein n=1 Tax=Dermatophagoides farinae TaxID=6954 RepID=A0A922I2V7_DERFA|nr:hypothetical protein DERF_008181 [Dermatophagoides farinae]KAH9521399.1 hypothetical protein DERF_005061 [Dermatophagoides farinae]
MIIHSGYGLLPVSVAFERPDTSCHLPYGSQLIHAGSFLLLGQSAKSCASAQYGHTGCGSRQSAA